MRIKLPRAVGRRYWMRKLPFNFKVKLTFAPNNPADVFYILTR